MATIDMSIEKISTIIGIVGALSASVGGYFVMEERQSVLMAEVQTLRESAPDERIVALETELESIKVYRKAFKDLAKTVAGLETRIQDSNPAEFTRKVERMEERLNNVVKSLDRIQSNDNPLSM